MTDEPESDAFHRLLWHRRPKLVRAVQIWASIKGNHPAIYREQRVDPLSETMRQAMNLAGPAAGGGEARGLWVELDRCGREWRKSRAGVAALELLGWGRWQAGPDSSTGRLGLKHGPGGSAPMPRWLLTEEPADLDRDPPDEVPVFAGLWLAKAEGEAMVMAPVQRGQTLRREVVAATWAALGNPPPHQKGTREEVARHAPRVFSELLDTGTNSILRNELKNLDYPT